MKKTTQAIKYALDELKVTPDYLFQLLESAQGYSGDNYELWLANKIIEIAASEGIPFTELLVKKLKILASLMSNAEDGISDLVSSFIDRWVEGTEDVIYDFSGVGYNKVTSQVEDFDWFNGISLIDSTLEENNTDNSTYIGILDSKGAGKSEITVEAKSSGLPINSKGGAMLYRLLLMDDILEPENNTYVFISDSSFFKDNYEIVSQFMSRFDLMDAIYLNKSDTMKGSFASGLDVITVWKTYSPERETLNSILARSYPDGENSLLFYSDREELMENYITSGKDIGHDEVSTLTLDLEFDEVVDVDSSDYEAYLSLNGTQRVADFPIQGSRAVVALNDDNLKDIIVFFGASQALEGSWGYGRGLGRVLTGLEGYHSLVANCLPIFLFGSNSLFHTYTDNGSTYQSQFNYDSDLVNSLYEELSPFMSFEAKVLWRLGVEYSQAMVKGNPDVEGLSFYQIRHKMADQTFDTTYQNNLDAVLAYVRKQVKGYLC